MDHPDTPSPAGRDPEPGNPEQLRARAIARGRREAMHRRARRIRRTVAGATAALFAAAFLGIYVQLASGHDSGPGRESETDLGRDGDGGRQHERHESRGSPKPKSASGSKRARSKQNRPRARAKRIVLELDRKRIELGRRPVLRHHLAVVSATEAIERFDCFGGSLRRDRRRRRAGARAPPRPPRGPASVCSTGTAVLAVPPRQRVVAAERRPARVGARQPADGLPGGDRPLRGRADRRSRRRDADRRPAGGRLRRRAPAAAAARAGARAGAGTRARRAGSPARRWRSLHADTRTASIARPPGLALDSGGLAKGLFADVLGEELAGHESFAVDCGGDLAIGGTAGLARRIDVQSPFDGTVLHSFELAHAGVATSGIGRRAWLGADGRPAHHLLDPATGRPAFTGVVQATALAPSAVLAEIHAKAAVLSGPVDGPGLAAMGRRAGARRRLPPGGRSRGPAPKLRREPPPRRCRLTVRREFPRPRFSANRGSAHAALACSGADAPSPRG